MTADGSAINLPGVARAIALAALTTGLLVALASTGSAQTLGGGSGPIEIEAEDGIEWLRDEQLYHARGNAVATQGDLTVRADLLTAHYKDAEGGGDQVIYRLDAIQNVIITSGETEASGDKAVYHIERRVAVLVGEDLQMITDRGTITAEESLEYWQDKSIAVARGDATIIQQDRRLRAGVLTAFVNRNAASGKSEVTRIDATGGVHISTPSDIVRGREGVYDVAKEQITLCGNVKITRGGNQLNGECATVDMRTGRSRMDGGKDKVKALILSTE